MAAGELDITIEQGATFQRTITYKDSEEDPVDLTGATVRGQLRRSYQDPTSISFVMTLTDAENGEFSWVLSAAATAAISTSATRNYVYDIEIEYSGGVVERVLQGKATISPEVTR